MPARFLAAVAMFAHRMQNWRIALLVVVIGVVAGSVVVVGQTVTDEQSQDTSYLRVAHASPDAPAVDVYLNNESALTNVSFGAVSEYQQLPAGTYNVTVTAAGDREAVVFDGNLSVEPREAVTVAATGEITDNATTAFEPVVYSDDALTPDENTSAVSVVHLVPDAPTVDVTVAGTNTTIADNVSFQDASDYVNVPAGNYTLEVRQATAGDNGTVVTTVPVSLAGGEAYSGLAVGYLAPDDAPADTPFDVVVTRDATKTISLPSADDTTNETATPTTGTMTEPTTGTVTPDAG